MRSKNVATDTARNTPLLCIHECTHAHTSILPKQDTRAHLYLYIPAHITTPSALVYYLSRGRAAMANGWFLLGPVKKPVQKIHDYHSPCVYVARTPTPTHRRASITTPMSRSARKSRGGENVARARRRALLLGYYCAAGCYHG